MAEAKKTTTKRTRSTTKPKTTRTKSTKARAEKPATVKVEAANADASSKSSQANAKRPKKDRAVLAPAKLRIFNIITAVLLLVEAIALVALSSSQKGLTSIFTTFSTKDSLASSSVGKTVYSQATEHLFDINLLYVLTALLVIAAAVNFVAAFWKRKQYEEGITSGANTLRAVSWALSGGLAMYAVALVSGVSDLTTLLIVVIASIAAAASWLRLERANPGTQAVKWHDYWIGLVAGFIPWLIVIIYAGGSALYGSGLPWYAYLADAVMLVATVAISILTHRYFTRNIKGSDNVYRERTMLIISFLANSALVWVIFAGMLRK